MTIREAARTVKISYSTGRNYYNEYKNNPEEKISSPRNRFMHPQRVYTQQDIESSIAYIEDDKMSVSKASSKASMDYVSDRYYYAKYLQDLDHNIPVSYLGQCYTQDQREVLIGYTINDKMSIRAASKKAKMTHVAGRRHYHKYFNIQNLDIATPSNIASSRPPPTQKQIKELVGYIVDDKVTITAASRKSNMSIKTARK